MKKRVLAMSVLTSLVLVAGCYNDASQNGDGTGGDGAGGSTSSGDNCPAVGDNCYSEGSDCESATRSMVCHCGEWVEEDDADNACNNQDPDTCKAGMACSGSGSCDGLVCHCGMWMNPAYTGNVTCNGDGGSGGGSSGGTYTVTFTVHGNAYHIWCEGGAVEAYAPDVSDDQIQWYEYWHSFGGDTFGPEMPPGQHPGQEWLDHSVTVTVPTNASLRAQCYLNTNGTETSGDLVRYAFADPTQLMSGEWVSVTRNGSSVYPPQGPDAYLVNNLDPQGFSENLQIDPP